MPQETEEPPDAFAAKLAQVLPVMDILDWEVPRFMAARMEPGEFGDLVDA
jgi:hypothetical protein